MKVKAYLNYKKGLQE